MANTIEGIDSIVGTEILSTSTTIENTKKTKKAQISTGGIVGICVGFEAAMAIILIILKIDTAKSIKK